MGYEATCADADGVASFGSYEEPWLAWQRLIDLHEGRLNTSRLSDDRVLRRMELRSDAAADGRELGTGTVTGPDPLDPAEMVAYSVNKC